MDDKPDTPWWRYQRKLARKRERNCQEVSDKFKAWRKAKEEQEVKRLLWTVLTPKE